MLNQSYCCQEAEVSSFMKMTFNLAETQGFFTTLEIIFSEGDCHEGSFVQRK